MKNLSFQFSLVVMTFLWSLSPCYAQLTDISGQWHVKSDNRQIILIQQNQQYLTFSMSNTSSDGYFSKPNEIYATAWDALGYLSADGNQITWNNQTWVRSNTAPQTDYPQIAGTYYVDGDKDQVVKISQNGAYLEFTMPNSRSSGYFTSAQQIHATEWNTYARISPEGDIQWGNQNWNKQAAIGTRERSGPTNSGTSDRNSASVGDECRVTLSVYYHGGQSLGNVWGRCVNVTGPLSRFPNAIVDIQASLDATRESLMQMGCIAFDLSSIDAFRRDVVDMTGPEVIERSERMIKDLQRAVAEASPPCDNGVNILDIYTAGVHLGAAQAWAATRMCQPAPMPNITQGVIRNHLNTAQAALRRYQACLPFFDINVFNNVNLASALSVEAHTAITGIETQVLWNIGISDCCCNCPPRGRVTPTTETSHSGNTCDDDCQKYCKSQGKTNGKYNNKTLCIGLVEQPWIGCDCWN